jgi:hypothetical protein
MANRLAATLARWIKHCIPTSIAGDCAVNLDDTRQNGCLAAVKVITSPEATIQAVTTKRKKFFDSVCRHAGDAMKLLPEGFVDFQDVALHRQRYISVDEPWKEWLADGSIEDQGSKLTVNTKTAATGINSFVIAPVCIKYAVLATTYAELQSKTCCKKTMAKSFFLVAAFDSFSTGSLRMSFWPRIATCNLSIVPESEWRDLYHLPKTLPKPRHHHHVPPRHMVADKGWRGIV